MTKNNDRSRGRIRNISRWLMEPGESLRSRALNAGLWASALTLSMRLLRLVRTVVLARLLAPDDFGLFAFAVLALATIDSFTKTGIAQALIQREGSIDEHLNTAWTVGVIRGLLVGFVLFAGAPLAADFFREPEAVSLIRAMALVPVATGLINIGVVFFDKDLQFRERFMFRSVPILVDLAVSVAFAIWLRNAWALLLGQVLSVLVTVAASYVAHPFRPRLHIDRARAKELLRFGKWISASAILVFLMFNLDDIVVGRLLTPSDLGLYRMAFTITTIITVEIAFVVNQVAFPVFAKLQTDKPGLRRAFLETLQLVAFASIPLTAGLWFVGEPAIETLLGSEWLGMLPAYGPLLLWGLMRTMLSTARPLFDAIGKPYVNSATFGASTALLAIFIVPFTTNWGIGGAAWATVIASGALAGQFMLAGRELRLRWGELLAPIAIPGSLTAIMYLALIALRPLFDRLEAGWFLVLAPALGVLVFGAGTWVAARLFDYTPLKTLFRFSRGQEDGVESEDI